MRLSYRGSIACVASALVLVASGAWLVTQSPARVTKAVVNPALARAQASRSSRPRDNRLEGTRAVTVRRTPARAEALAERLLELWSDASGDDDEASRIVAELLSLEEAAAAPLLRVLEREPPGSVRDRLFDILRQVPGSQAESGLIAEALATDAGMSRTIAIEALGERGTAAALEALNSVARTDPQVLEQPFLTTTTPDADDLSTELPDEVLFTPRMKAMNALAASGNAAAIPMLAAVLQQEPDQALRMEAATALGRLRSDLSSIEALAAAALADRSPYVRLAALHALAGVLDPGLVEPLGRVAAGDGHPGVRLLASRVLAQLNENLRSAELGG